MTKNTADKAPRRSRTGVPNAATRITTAGLAVAVTIGLGGAVTARAADQKRVDANQAKAAQDAAALATGNDMALKITSIQEAERAKVERRVNALRAKYQKALDDLAAEYNALLGNDSTGSPGSGSGSGSYSSGGSSTSGGSSSGRGSSSGGGSKSGGSSSSGGSAPAPHAPSVSKGS